MSAKVVNLWIRIAPTGWSAGGGCRGGVARLVGEVCGAGLLLAFGFEGLPAGGRGRDGGV